jgi:hypothetical protein
LEEESLFGSFGGERGVLGEEAVLREEKIGVCIIL